MFRALAVKLMHNCPRLPGVTFKKHVCVCVFLLGTCLSNSSSVCKLCIVYFSDVKHPDSFSPTSMLQRGLSLCGLI